jgi:hypothetical protein
MTKVTLVLLLFRARHGLAVKKKAESLQHRQLARSDVTLQDLIGTFGSTGASSAANAGLPATGQVGNWPIGSLGCHTRGCK